MNYVFTFLFLLTSGVAFGQLYQDASDQLPNFGSQTAAMDVQAADIDNDNDLDVVLANEGQKNTVLQNDGTGNFTNISNQLPNAFHDSEDVQIVDLNGDQFPDLVFCSEDDILLNITDVHEFYLGDGMGNFTEAAFQFPDTEANAVVVADINNDQIPDVLFGNNGGTGVFIGNGDGTFSEESDRIIQFNLTTQDLGVADVDGDNDLDVFEANEDGNLLHINDGNGFFTNQTAARLPTGFNLETRKVTFGDVDGDDDLDIFLSNVSFIPGKDPKNRLYINDGNGFFTDQSFPRLPTEFDQTLEGIFEDVDLDNDLDLITGNFAGTPIKVYENDGNGNFDNKTLEILGQEYFRDALGIIAADLNGDGLRDLYVCDRKLPNNTNKDLLLIRNLSTSISSAEAEKEVQVFPNPVKGRLHIHHLPEGIDSLQVFDLKGALIDELAVGANQTTIIWEQIDWPVGTYILKVGQQQKKVFVVPK
ncbi:MAG: T9SS type A sorting domain-containing protein [Bacteroidota bacterium]